MLNPPYFAEESSVSGKHVHIRQVLTKNTHSLSVYMTHVSDLLTFVSGKKGLI